MKRLRKWKYSKPCIHNAGKNYNKFLTRLNQKVCLVGRDGDAFLCWRYPGIGVLIPRLTTTKTIGVDTDDPSIIELITTLEDESTNGRILKY